MFILSLLCFSQPNGDLSKPSLQRVTYLTNPPTTGALQTTSFTSFTTPTLTSINLTNPSLLVHITRQNPSISSVALNLCSFEGDVQTTSATFVPCAA